MPGGAWHDGAEVIATDLIGFNSVQKHPEGSGASLPFNDRLWTLFATAGGWSLSHIDADGAATIVQPCHGTKLWFIIRAPGVRTPHTFAWPEQFNPPWELDRANFWDFMEDHTLRHLLSVEVMVLEGNMRLYVCIHFYSHIELSSLFVASCNPILRTLSCRQQIRYSKVAIFILSRQCATRWLV